MDLKDTLKDLLKFALKEAFEADTKVINITQGAIATQMTTIYTILIEKGIVTMDEIQEYQKK